MYVNRFGILEKKNTRVGVDKQHSDFGILWVEVPSIAKAIGWAAG